MAGLGKYDYLLYDTNSDSSGDDDNDGQKNNNVDGDSDTSDEITDDDEQILAITTAPKPVAIRAPTRRSYSVRQKLKYIDQYMNRFKCNASEFERFHRGKIKRRMIVSWHKQKDHLERVANNPNLAHRRRAPENEDGSTKGKFHELEAELLNWIKLQQSLHNSTTDEEIRNQAMNIYTARNETAPFKASNGWINRFKRRHKIPRRPHKGRKKKEQDMTNGLNLISI